MQKRFVLMILVCVGVAQDVLVAKEAELKTESFGNCVLHEVEGRIWLQHPIVKLGMIGATRTPPFCLSEELAKQFAPLVSRIVPENKARPERFYDEMPKLREQRGHFVLVSMKAQMRGIFGKRPQEADQSERVIWPEYYEIVKARMASAEFVSAEWIEGWRTVDEALKEVVWESLAAPGQKKRKRLAKAIEKCSRALNSMAEMKTNDDFRTSVGKVDPNARVVGTFKRRIAEHWQGWLEKFAGSLGIEPKTPLPRTCKRVEAVKLLAESESAAEFMSKLRESCPGDALDVELIWSDRPRPALCAWEVEGLSEVEFNEVRDKAKEMVAKIRDVEKERAEQETSEEMEKWGVVFGPAGADLLAEKLILRGAVVKKVLTDKPQVGLQVGDVVVYYYGDIHDVVWGWHSRGYWMEELRWQDELRVLRGDNTITISLGRTRGIDVLIVIKIIGMVLVLMGTGYLLKPSLIRGLMEFFKKGDRTDLAAMISAALAAVLASAPRECKNSWVIVAFVILFLVSGLLILLIRPKRLRPILEWWQQRSNLLLRALALATLVAGVVIIMFA